LFICRNYNSEEECTIIDDDDDNDDTVSRNRGTKRTSSTVGNAKWSRLEIGAGNSQSFSGIGKAARRMGVNFDSDDSSDEDNLDRSIPKRKSKR